MTVPSSYPASSYAANTVSSWEVISALEARLAAALSDVKADDPKPAKGYIRFTTSSDQDDSGAYKAEDGVHIIVGDPQPFDKDGAGRAGKRVRRVFELWLVTRSNADRVGDVRVALQKHLALEDLVFDALDDTPPFGSVKGWQTEVGIRLHWIPGGEEVKRKKKVAPDTFISVHLFEVIYTQKMRVTRSNF